MCTGAQYVILIRNNSAIMNSLPEWTDLRFFLELARAGTLSGASRRLEVEHTTVARSSAPPCSTVRAKATN
jgi:hypothetical protein